MAKKSILKNCSIEVAKRNRKCCNCSSRTKQMIQSGEKCLVFKESLKSPNSYCIQCAKNIIAEGKKNLENLEQALTVL